MSDIHKSFLGRIEEISDNISKERWYRENQDSLILIRKSICDNIDANLKKLLDEYDSLCLEINCKTIEEIYKKAYQDGFSDALSMTPILTPKLTPNP